MVSLTSVHSSSSGCYHSEREEVLLSHRNCDRNTLNKSTKVTLSQMLPQCIYRRACGILFWPRMHQDIKDEIQCKSLMQCNKKIPPKKPPKQHPVPEVPWSLFRSCRHFGCRLLLRLVGFSMHPDMTPKVVKHHFST